MAIGILATLNVKTECITEFESAFLQYQQTVKNTESGNVYFSLHKSRSTPGTYIVMEQYLNEAALSAHTSADYYQAIPQTFGQYMAGPADIEILDAVA